MKNIELSVIIVNWNVKDSLKRSLRSIYEQLHSIEYEIIVVDNASSDGSQEMIQDNFPQIVLIKNNINLGFAKANNIGVLKSRGQYLLFLNPDTEIVTNNVDELVRFLQANTQYVAVGPKILNRDGTIQFSCARSLPTPTNQLFEMAMFHRIFPKSKFFGKARLSYWDHKTNRDVECLSGASIVIAKESFIEAGCFDERYFLYAEDIDLCFKLKKSGFKLHYISDTEILHHSQESSKKVKKSAFSAIAIHEADKMFMRCHYGITSACLYQLFIFIGAILRCIVLFFFLLQKFVVTKGRDFSVCELNSYYKIAKWALGTEKWAYEFVTRGKLII